MRRRAVGVLVGILLLSGFLLLPRDQSRRAYYSTVEGFRSDNPEIRLIKLRELQQHEMWRHSPEALPVVREIALGDPNPQIRSAAFSALVARRGPAYISFPVDALQFERDPAVLHHIGGLLGFHSAGGEEGTLARDALDQALAKPNAPLVAGAFLWRMRRSGDPQVRAWLLAAYRCCADEEMGKAVERSGDLQLAASVKAIQAEKRRATR